MATTALQKITARAKQLRSKSKNLKWVQAIKKASRQLKSEKKIGGNAIAKRSVKVTRTRKIKIVSGNGLAGTKQQAKDKFAKACLDYELATTIKATKEAQERKNKWRKILRSL